MISKHILLITFLNELKLIFLKVKWFYLFLSDTNKSIYNWFFVCSQLKVFKYSYLTQILDEALYISNRSYTLGKGMNPTILPPTVSYSR